MSRALFLAASLAFPLLAACGEEPVRPAPAPPIDGGTILCPTGCPTPMDGGPRDLGGSIDDGGRDARADAGLDGFCASFPRAGSSITRPLGFAPTHIAAHWDTATCAHPELVVALSEGDCDLVDGERIELRFAEERVLDGSILIGINTIYVDGTHPLRMSYVRTDAPSATFGSCGTGTIDIDTLALTRTGRFVASFDVALDDCDLVGDTGVGLVGSFDVPIVESSADACP